MNQDPRYLSVLVRTVASYDSQTGEIAVGIAACPLRFSRGGTTALLLTLAVLLLIRARKRGRVCSNRACSAQAMNVDGLMVDDFVFGGSEGVSHLRNAPSRAATSSLAIGKYIANDADNRSNLT